MELKEEIQGKFGSITQLAHILTAPKQTLHSWTRPKNRHHPPNWVVRAAIDAGTYRSKRVAGWSCRGCGCITEATNAALRPPSCGACGGRNFTPVSVIHEQEPITKDGTQNEC